MRSIRISRKSNQVDMTQATLGAMQAVTAHLLAGGEPMPVIIDFDMTNRDFIVSVEYPEKTAKPAGDAHLNSKR